MTLADHPVGAAIAVSDMKKAEDFYESKLGLSATGDDPDGGRTYRCGGQTTLHVFPSPHAGGSGATAAGWQVTDIERVVDDLTANGVSFERYDQPPMKTDEKGIAVMGPGKGAWFKDPDGNTFALIQV